jgi:hypothetical protein
MKKYILGAAQTSTTFSVIHPPRYVRAGCQLDYIKRYALRSGPSTVVEPKEIFLGEVSLEERGHGWTDSLPTLVVRPSVHGVAIKSNQTRVKAEQPSVHMGTVTCDRCGFQNPTKVEAQVKELEELLAEEHRRKLPHGDSIKLPDKSFI